MVSGKLLQRLKHIVHEYALVGHGVFSLINHSVRAAFIQSRLCKLVAVKTLALESEENRAFRNYPTTRIAANLILLCIELRYDSFLIFYLCREVS